MTDTIYSLFRNVVEKYPDRPAVIESQRTMTFKELLDLVDLIAGSFPLGTSSVGIVMSHRAEMVAAMLAVVKCGARYVPAEPSFPAGRIRYMMQEAAVDFVLTETPYEGMLSGFTCRLADCEICAEQRRHAGEDLSRPQSSAYVLYTSGTTGRPKGVSVTNMSVCHYVKAFENEFRPAAGDVMLQYSVCSFDIFVEEVFASLLNGVAIAIPTDEDKDNIRALMRFADKHKVTIISGFPYLLAEMNNLPSIPSSIRLLISGGDVLRAVYVDRLLNQAEVYNTYGPSETTVCASYYRCNGNAALSDGTYPIGKAVKGAEILITDEAGKEVPAGSAGEICIYGDGVSQGYIGNHDEENRAFERLEDGRVRYRSGDLGYLLPSGDIAFLRRKDNQIMIYGKRVELSEVEATLYRCRHIERAVVRAFSDENNLPYMIAYVVPSDKNLKVSRLRKELSEQLAPFMIPEYIVKMPSIPLNGNGKPDVEKLPVVMKEGSRL